MNIFSAHMMLKQYRRLKRPRSKVSKETLVYTAILIAGTAMLYLQFTAAWQSNHHPTDCPPKWLWQLNGTFSVLV